MPEMSSAKERCGTARQNGSCRSTSCAAASTSSIRSTGAARTITVGQPVGAAVPRRGGGLLLAVRDGFAHLDRRDVGTMTFVAHVELDLSRIMRMNDGACDAAGPVLGGHHGARRAARDAARFIASTPTVRRPHHADRRRHLERHRLEPRRHAHVLRRQPDAAPRRLRLRSAQRARSRTAGRSRAIDPAEGSPDGLTVDAEGACGSPSGEARRCAGTCRTARLERVLPLPVTLSDDVRVRRTGPRRSLHHERRASSCPPDERRQQPLAGSVCSAFVPASAGGRRTRSEDNGVCQDSSSSTSTSRSAPSRRCAASASPCAGRDARAGGRERRRQVHAAQDPRRHRRARRGEIRLDDGGWRCRQPARSARARHRHGLPGDAVASRTSPSPATSSPAAS